MVCFVPGGTSLPKALTEDVCSLRWAGGGGVCAACRGRWRHPLRRAVLTPSPNARKCRARSGGVERLTFSALWEMTREAETVSVRFTKAAIRSRAALTYAEAQARIDDAALDDDITRGARAAAAAPAS